MILGMPRSVNYATGRFVLVLHLARDAIPEISAIREPPRESLKPTLRPSPDCGIK